MDYEGLDPVTHLAVRDEDSFHGTLVNHVRGLAMEKIDDVLDNHLPVTLGLHYHLLFVPVHDVASSENVRSTDELHRRLHFHVSLLGQGFFPKRCADHLSVWSTPPGVNLGGVKSVTMTIDRESLM